jgi:DNA polymerase III alpha subunit
MLPPEAAPGRPAAAPLDSAYIRAVREQRGVFDDDRLSLALTRLAGPDGRALGQAVHRVGAELGVPLLATFDAHAPERRALQDVVTCIRNGVSLDRAGLALFPNGERHLRAPEHALARYADAPELLALIAELRYAPYFLTVHDLVRFARAPTARSARRSGSRSTSSIGSRRTSIGGTTA